MNVKPQSIVEFFRSSPLVGADIDFNRQRDEDREVSRQRPPGATTPTKKRFAFSVLLALSAIAIAGVLIGAVYDFFLPRFFPGPGWGTYSPLFLGVSITAAGVGYIGYCVPSTDRRSIRIGFGACYAFVAAGLVSWLALLIILNVRGS